MANEFIARNGLIAQNNSVITGSLIVTAGITGSLQGTASYVAAGGSNTMVQFNDSGSFSGIAGVTIDKNNRSLQNGESVSAVGSHSHAQGINSVATGNYSHAEGTGTKTIGNVSHAEGRATVTVGAYSHAEGFGSKTGDTAYSCSINAGIVEIDATQGDLTGTYTDGTIIWFGDVSSVGNSILKGIVTGSSFNGTNTIFQLLNDTTTTITSAGILDPSGNLSNQLGGYSAHAEGGSTVANGDYSHAEGETSTTYGYASHAEGISTTYGDYSHAEGEGSSAYGYASHAEGVSTTYGPYSHAEGDSTTSGYNAYTTLNIAAGVITFPSYYGDLSVTFAPGTVIYVDDAAQYAVLIHEVASSLLSGSGETTVTLVDTTYNPNANWYVGVQGNPQPAFADSYIGNSSHAEGRSTTTLAAMSHAEGYNTITHGYYQNVVGQYNAPVSVSSSFVIGNGDATTPSNLLVAYGNTVQITGSLTVSGSVTGSFTGSFVGDGSGLTGVGATEYIRRSDYTASLDPNVNYLYTGYAPVGSAESATVWTLSRLAISASGDTTTQVTASAAWTNRYSYTYL